VNSYKRLVVGRALSGATWAPAYIAYGDNNRTACVRVPYGRLEIRLPDSGCNPYPHTVGFRNSPAFAEWRAYIGPYFESPPVVEHFRAVGEV